MAWMWQSFRIKRHPIGMGTHFCERRSLGGRSSECWDGAFIEADSRGVEMHWGVWGGDAGPWVQRAKSKEQRLVKLSDKLAGRRKERENWADARDFAHFELHSCFRDRQSRSHRP